MANERYTNGVSFLPKMVYKRVRVGPNFFLVIPRRYLHFLRFHDVIHPFLTFLPPPHTAHVLTMNLLSATKQDINSFIYSSVLS